MRESLQKQILRCAQDDKDSMANFGDRRLETLRIFYRPCGFSCGFWPCGGELGAELGPALGCCTGLS